jgi:uncharacterized membrane protein
MGTLVRERPKPIRLRGFAVKPRATDTWEGAARWEPSPLVQERLSAQTLLLAPFALAFDRPGSTNPSAATIASVLAIASLSTALAYVVYFRILAGAGATNVQLVTLLVPATSVALGAALLGERLAPRQLLGYALIAAGLAFIDGRAPRALSRALAGPARAFRLPTR